MSEHSCNRTLDKMEVEYHTPRVRAMWIGAHGVLTPLGDLPATLHAMQRGEGRLQRAEGDAWAVGRVALHTQGAEVEATLEKIATQHRDTHSIERVHIARLLRGSRVGELLLLGAWALEQELGGKVYESLGSSVRLIISTTKGDVESLFTCATPHSSITDIPSSAYLWQLAAWVNTFLGLKQEALVVSQACISGISALQVSRYLLEKEQTQHVVILGADEVGRFVLEGFGSLGALSEQGCRPYSVLRDGMSLGEACGWMVLSLQPPQDTAEERRLAILGISSTNDGAHLARPNEEGTQLQQAIQSALAESGEAYEALACINGHGTGTLYNDAMELCALQGTGLMGIPLNGLKGYIGHSLGASALVEVLVCGEELRTHKLIGTLGYEGDASMVGWSLRASPQPIEGAYALKLGSGFGGCNGAVVVGYATPHALLPKDSLTSATFTHYATRCAARWQAQGKVNDGTLQRLRCALPKKTQERYRRMSGHARWCVVGVQALLQGQENLLTQLDKKRVGVVFANKSSSLPVDWEHVARITGTITGGVSPGLFLYTLGNAALSEVCITQGFHGENIFFVEREPSELPYDYGRWLITSGRCVAVVCGWVEEDSVNYNLNLAFIVRDKV